MSYISSSFTGASDPDGVSRLSRATAEAILRNYGQRASATAANIALLFEIGHEFLRGAQQMLLAAKGTIRVSPGRSTIGQALRGLAMAANSEDGPDKTQVEFNLQSVLGACYSSLEGYSSIDAGRAHHRAYELGIELGDESCLFTPLWGLWGFEITRGDSEAARSHVAQAHEIATNSQQPALLVAASYASGLSTLHAGQLAAAEAYFRGGVLFTRQRETTLNSCSIYSILEWHVVYTWHKRRG
jgi:hypothetical protein